MTVPSENRKIMRDLGREADYSWDKPARIPPKVGFESYLATKYVLEHAAEFRVMWDDSIIWLMGSQVSVSSFSLLNSDR